VTAQLALAGVPMVGKEPDFYSLIAVEDLGAPAGWRWYELEVLGDHKSPRAKTSFLMRGAVCTAVLKSGPNKGMTNWKLRDRTTERTFVVSFADYDAFRVKWLAANAPSSEPAHG
jgi:hypothetical protein